MSDLLSAADVSVRAVGFHWRITYHCPHCSERQSKVVQDEPGSFKTTCTLCESQFRVYCRAAFNDFYNKAARRDLGLRG